MANAIRTAGQVIREHLRGAPGGWLPWSEVMDLALYAPGSGYYRQGVRRIGRGGDFFTSVSVGPLFGALLAENCVQIWEAMGRPGDFAILEQGANDGALAADVLEALKASHPELAAKVRYIIVEPDEAHRAAQSACTGRAVEHAVDWAALREGPRHGILICNELLDAFPIHRICFSGGRWQELGVREGQDGTLGFVPADIVDAGLKAELDLMGNDFPEGSLVEVNLSMLQWMRDVSQSAFCGAVLLADYGYARDPDDALGKSRDTLRRYHQHRMDGKVLENLGECDLTAHVDFTRLAQAAMKEGLEVVEFIEQGRYLTRLASGMMQKPGFHPSAVWMRQFQTLTHPGHLGHSFQVMVLAKGVPATKLSPPSHLEAAGRRLGLDAEPS